MALHSFLDSHVSSADNPYHVHTIRTSLTRNLHACFPDVRDEIVCAFNDVLQLQGSGADESHPLLPHFHRSKYLTQNGKLCRCFPQQCRSWRASAIASSWGFPYVQFFVHLRLLRLIASRQK
jgi:hypothetical protein